MPSECLSVSDRDTRYIFCINLKILKFHAELLKRVFEIFKKIKFQVKYQIKIFLEFNKYSMLSTILHICFILSYKFLERI